MRVFSLIFQLLFVVAIFACKKPVETETLSQWSGKANPIITQTSLYDTLPGKALAGVAIHELKGIKAAYPSGGYTCYFEYEADADATLRAISMLPFRRSSEFSDTIPRAMEQVFSSGGSKLISPEELASSSFFWNINSNEYEYYECVKSPVRHTLLVNRVTGRILHRIEAES